VVYKALLSLKERGVLAIGSSDSTPAKSGFLPPEDLAAIGAKLVENAKAGEDGTFRIVLFVPDPAMLEDLVQALGK